MPFVAVQPFTASWLAPPIVHGVADVQLAVPVESVNAVFQALMFQPASVPVASSAVITAGVATVCFAPLNVAVHDRAAGGLIDRVPPVMSAVPAIVHIAWPAVGEHSSMIGGSRTSTLIAW